MMLGRKPVFFSVASVLLISLAAFFLGSQRKEPAPVIVYKTAVYSPKTETQEPSPSPLNSEVERGTTSDNDRTDSSETDAEAYLQSPDFDGSLDDAFFGEILDAAESVELEEDGDNGVSPFGYGEYPDRPDGYPRTPIWAYPDEVRLHYSQNDSELERQFELMDRVAIKMWEMGYTDFKGGVFSEGKVYLTFPDTVYVKVTEFEAGVSVEAIGGVISEEDIELLRVGKSPAGMTVLDMSEGIDPISFLGL